MTHGPVVEQPSLEALVETGMLALESPHPGGLETTRHLAAVCNIQEGDAVLDAASGTGETACCLAQAFGARVCGVDRADEMIRRAESKASNRKRSRGGGASLRVRASCRSLLRTNPKQCRAGCRSPGNSLHGLESYYSS